MENAYGGAAEISTIERIRASTFTITSKTSILTSSYSVAELYNLSIIDKGERK